MVYEKLIEGVGMPQVPSGTKTAPKGRLWVEEVSPASRCPATRYAAGLEPPKLPEPLERYRSAPHQRCGIQPPSRKADAPASSWLHAGRIRRRCLAVPG